MFFVVDNRFANRKIAWLNLIGNSHQLTLYSVKPGLRHPDGRQFRNTVFSLNSNNDITPSPITEIIGKGTYRMKYRFRIPACLEFKPFPFYDASPNQFIDIYR